MKTWGSTFLKSVFLGLMALIIVGVSHTAAHADEVTVTGNTTGNVVGAPALVFTGNPFFTATTALGVGSLSGANSLGSFFLNPGPLQALNGTFTLNINFTSPAGIRGGQGAVYIATISGSVAPIMDMGGVLVHFTNPSQTFGFFDGLNNGPFTVTIADVFVQTGRPADLTAKLWGTQNQVPEPTTLLLLGTGLAGIAAKLRQRSRTQKNMSPE